MSRKSRKNIIRNVVASKTGSGQVRIARFRREVYRSDAMAFGRWTLNGKPMRVGHRYYSRTILRLKNKTYSIRRRAYFYLRVIIRTPRITRLLLQSAVQHGWRFESGRNSRQSRL